MLKKMASKVPNVTFNNGQTIPMLGLGTWGSPPGEVAQAVKDAIDVGYRHIDCAHVYGNECEVGEGLTYKIKEGVVKREDMFITSKLWNTFHRPDLVRGAMEKTLKDLQTKYVDLYLMHWPFAYKEEGALFPNNPNGSIAFSNVDYLDTWKEMEKLVDAGLAKSIGMSNFNKKQTERLLANCRIKPVTNQFECHPYLTQVKLSDFTRQKGIEVTAYSPLGSPNRPWVTSNDPVLLDDPNIVKIAKKHNKTTAQVLIRYQIQRQHIVIPKSVTKSRIISNFDVFSFELSKEEMDVLTSFECNGRICPMTGCEPHPDYPFHDEY